MVRKLAEMVERRRQQVSHGSQSRSQQWTQFCREGEAGNTASRRPAPTLLVLGEEWRMEVDLGRQHTLWPDVELCAITGRSPLLIELIVPWEERMEEWD